MNTLPHPISSSSLIGQFVQFFSARFKLRTILFGLSMISISVAAQAPLDIRVALIIGNAAYMNAPSLANSGNDAREMAKTMRKLGFKVIDVVDADKRTMDKALEDIQKLLNTQQAIAMLYYAGHGLQLDWHNYMVPIDANLRRAQDVPNQTIDIEKVIKVFKSAQTRMNIVVLDACRDNPFPGSTATNGLAQMDAPSGTYLAFATAPGNVAEDGDQESGNGLFTQYLIKELKTPARIEDVFKRVRLQVRQKSQGRQIPWDSSSLEEDFALNDGATHTISAAELMQEAKEAREEEERLKAAAQAAIEREIAIAKESEQERLRIAKEQQQREVELQAQRQRELELANQREIEKKRLADAKKIQEFEARQRAEAEALERDRLIALAEAEQKRSIDDAERLRIAAEKQAKERERQLALAAEEERKKALIASQALQRAQQQEAQRLKDLELAKAQIELEERLKKETEEKQFEIQKAEWDAIKDSKRANDFFAFLAKYPHGYITEQAQFALELLQSAQVVPQKDRGGFQETVTKKRFAVGDVYRYLEKDLATGNEIRRFTRKVEKIENQRVYISSGNDELEVRSLDGGVIVGHSHGKGHRQEYDPPRPDLPGDSLVVGKSWTGRSLVYEATKKRPHWREDKITVVGKEILETAIGPIHCFKLEMFSEEKKGKTKRTYWVDPEWGLPMRIIREAQRHSRMEMSVFEVQFRARVN